MAHDHARCRAGDDPDKFTAEMEFVGHIEVTEEEDLLDHDEQLERTRVLDREIYGDDYQGYQPRPSPARQGRRGTYIR